MQQPIPSQSLYHEQNLNLDDCVNNLNYANNEAASKYLRILQRSRINQQQQQQQYQQNIYQQQRDFLQQLNWLEHQDNTNSNTEAPSNTSTDLMYHNYNIQQSNKVGPKPNWRFRNLNEDYNPSSTINRLQSQAPQQQATTLPRYQNTLTFSQQPPSLGSNQHFLNLQPHNQAARNHDFLLRPSVDVNDDDEVNYNFLNTGQQQLPLDFSNPSAQHTTIHNIHNIPPECNENNDDEEDEEDDTTSEEIKRNLLVNALKNDKFTTKFYESIKEDVFRRLESMLLDKDNIQMQSTTIESQAQPQLFNNNISNNALRKLNLNEQRDQMQQQQQQQHLHQQPIICQPFESHTPQESYQTTRNDCLISGTTTTATHDNVDNENEKPEEDSNWRQNNINTPCSASSTPNQTSSIAMPTPTISKNCTKKRKNVRKQQSSTNNTTLNSNVVAAVAATTNEDENNENLRGACSLAAQHHQQQQQSGDKQNENKTLSSTNNANSTTILPSSSSLSSSTLVTPSQTNECDVIKYIISRIRNQTHANTLINDALLVEVAKLTATVAQNAQPLTQRNVASCSNNNNISPKKIYTKIKKLSIPKERDEFLNWYQQYLENTLFGACQKDEAKVKSTSMAKQANNQQTPSSLQNGVAQQQSMQTIQDDGDLAEADQNCSSNTSGNYHHLEDDTASKTLIITPNANSTEFEKAQKNKKDSIAIEGACALVTSSQQVEELTSLVSASEKNDIKTEKQEYNEKE